MMHYLLLEDWYWRSYGDFFSRGTDRQTDTIFTSSYGNMSAHKKIQIKNQNKELAVDRNIR